MNQERQQLPNLLGRLVLGDAAFEEQSVLIQEQALGPLGRGVADRDGTPLDAMGERIEAVVASVPEDANDDDEKDLNDEAPAPALAIAATDAVVAASEVLSAPIVITAAADAPAVTESAAPVVDTADQAAKAKRAKRGLAD